MKRFELINSLIKHFNYKTYLEIGYRKGHCFNRVIIDDKQSVDPDNTWGPTFALTSNEFFEKNSKIYDIIFIDGLHLHEQVRKDIANGLKFLSENGTIVCHDMLPVNEGEQIREYTPGKVWTGDVWKEWVRLRMTDNTLDMKVVKTDHGCGIIRKGKQELVPLRENLTFEDLKQNYKSFLNIISVDEFMRLYG